MPVSPQNSDPNNDVNISEPMPYSIQYLPTIFHDEAERKSGPLWALLLTIEKNFDKVEKIIDDIDRYFDISWAPLEFLPWLASWMGFELDEEWPEQKKRFVLRQLHDLNCRRGTEARLIYMLSLYFGVEVEVTEWVWPQAMQIGERSTIGVNTILFEKPDLSSCFVLTWDPPAGVKEEEIRQKIRKIRVMIDREKPAHTLCYFHVK